MRFERRPSPASGPRSRPHILLFPLAPEPTTVHRVSPSFDELRVNLSAIRGRIADACERSEREPAGVRLVAAAKSVAPETIAWARDAGVQEVGENYVRELARKRPAIEGVTWHFIGALQSRSAPSVAELADVVQTIVPGRALRRLAGRAEELGRTIPVLIEVDLTGERIGVSPEELPHVADEVAETPGLELTGLMTLPPIPSAAEDSRPHFRRLRELQGRVAERHPKAVELSMGMSLDYEVAVEEGATIIRIGTALFGARVADDRGRT